VAGSLPTSSTSVEEVQLQVTSLPDSSVVSPWDVSGFSGSIDSLVTETRSSSMVP
jgi:hypothetical protein